MSQYGQLSVWQKLDFALVIDQICKLFHASLRPRSSLLFSHYSHLLRACNSLLWRKRCSHVQEAFSVYDITDIFSTVVRPAAPVCTPSVLSKGKSASTNLIFRALNPSSEDTYEAFAQEKAFKPETVTFGDHHPKAHWLGDKDAEKLIIWFPGT